MTELTDLSIAEARDKLAARECSAQELTMASLKAMDEARSLNIFITETPERALAMAESADASLKAGTHSPMTGIPVAVKDLFCTKGVRTTAGSRILDPFIPTYESTVTANLWQAGAVMLGKVNMDEFAMGSSNETSYYGSVINPWRAGDVQTVPGGSSGGSVAAVAARISPCATGTDTGGSIRQPAAFTGTVGLKPTYGRCSRFGMVAFASSLDQAGPIARSVRDCAIMLGAMAGYDQKDSTCVNTPVPDYEAALSGDIRGLKIGIPREYRVDGMSSEIDAMWQKAMDWLKDAGAEIVEISLPHTHFALPTYYIVAPAEASSNLARYDGVRYGFRAALEAGDGLTELYEKTRAEGFGDEVKRRILMGTYVLSAGYYDAYYLKAQKLRTLIADDFAHAWQKVDAILTPTAPSAAFAFGSKPDPLAMYMNDVFTVPASLAGLPGISIPAALSADGLPLGLQLLGRAFDEATVLKIADVMEKAAAFTARPADWWRKGA
ncbi:glutamyl-tRNA(Gln) amidotransferase subunit A [Iodidimonas nitroreducens]|uniref:Glutamyl-tRNA(Gln) amidotransferase subunit A n=1 Tax=Iodidimonas nitroreducens TaxID=1236968 RepID=A0A5A7NDK0_9PROT|nr:Asp-tRNA(Asn)/Glu-tRNA(Gln) amidotransferase subunit GatA [Iodidimonas nitroreducens]GAK34156.1 glutamyl-tRNA(Gln) amidotransferase subunit A [alpha proteobacterium Q-1]GER05149.1 glutamyl-tRNA(Gln) amidotransferase subunit A [Iodidimonas nitroreducens]